MADVSDYSGLITSEHSDKPKYMAMISGVTQGSVDQISLADDFVNKFDLDQAVGDQLDTIGLWVGISRRVSTPITGVYFSFDTTGLGFEQGVWQGPFDPSSGLTSLDDDTYRIVIRGKIGANHWDGTLPSAKAILDSIYPPGTNVFIQDNQDMSITFGLSGTLPNAVYLALLKGGYIPLKPEGVRVNFVITTTSDGSPIFGFDVDNSYVSGFDAGSWGQIL